MSERNCSTCRLLKSETGLLPDGRPIQVVDCKKGIVITQKELDEGCNSHGKNFSAFLNERGEIL